MNKALTLTLPILLLASAATAEVFTWTEQGGTRHYTNSIHEVPKRYRARVRILDVPSGKTSKPSPAQLNGQNEPTARPGDAAAAVPAVSPPAPAAQAPAPVAAPPAVPRQIAPAPRNAGQPVSRPTRRAHRRPHTPQDEE